MPIARRSTSAPTRCCWPRCGDPACVCMPVRLPPGCVLWALNLPDGPPCAAGCHPVHRPHAVWHGDRAVLSREPGPGHGPLLHLLGPAAAISFLPVIARGCQSWSVRRQLERRHHEPSGMPALRFLPWNQGGSARAPRNWPACGLGCWVSWEQWPPPFLQIFVELEGALQHAAGSDAREQGGPCSCA